MRKMIYTGRLQSFLVQPELFWKEEKKLSAQSTLDCIDRMAAVKGITHVEPNYPMHFIDYSVAEVENSLKKNNLALSGVALRYDQTFINGELTNQDRKIRDLAIRYANEAAEICQKMGGTTMTIWSANDGFDYPFQLDYQKAWKMLVDGVREIAQGHPDLKISIEYKPYEPRPFFLINDIATTLLAIEDAKCDNLGLTVDVAHMLMKKENPAYSLVMAAQRGRLFGVHFNDGYHDHDDGLIIGSVNLLQTLEFVYYMRKFDYQDVIFFDTFPLREDPIKECELNIQIFEAIWNMIDRIGEDRIEAVIAKRDVIEAQRLFLVENFLKGSV